MRNDVYDTCRPVHCGGELEMTALLQAVMKIVASGILYSVLEYLIPSGKIHRSASVVMRMLILLSISDILREYLR